MEGIEYKGWFFATLIMIFISLVVFIIQRFIVQLFGYAFEVCLFYVPTVVLLIVYLKERSQKGKP